MGIIKKMRRHWPVAHSWNACYLKGWYMTSGGLMFQTTTTGKFWENSPQKQWQHRGQKLLLKGEKASVARMKACGPTTLLLLIPSFLPK
jgi:hypothetical protein